MLASGSGFLVRKWTLGTVGVVVAVLAGVALLADVEAQAQQASQSPSSSLADVIRHGDNRIPGHFIVVFKDSVAAPADLAETQVEAKDGELGFVYPKIKGYSAELPEAAVKELRHDPRVAYIEQDARGSIAAQANPTGIERVFATANDHIAIDEQTNVQVDADVAVLDTGIEATHPDLNVVSQVDCTMGCIAGGSSGDHGTHVAGTIGALDNGYGVAGVAPGARIWGVRVLNAEGKGALSAYVAGIEWVTAHADEIEIANSSLRFSTEQSKAFEDALEVSLEAGVVHVAAAGNERETVRYVPGNYPDLITVSALEDLDGSAGEGKDTLALFSNFGSLVDVAAPGVEILSTVPKSAYAQKGWSGTSMASPHVAGAAAILASRDNPENEADVQAIRDAIVNAGNLDWVDTSGDFIKERLLDMSDKALFNPILPPDASTGPARAVNTHSATLHATIVPKAGPLAYQFEYGPTSAYGAKAPAPAKVLAWSDAGEVEVSTEIEGLQPATTYYYRVVAGNAGGNTQGEEATFTTPARHGPRFEAEALPVALEATQDDPLNLYIPKLGDGVSCQSVSFDGEASAASTELALDAAYSNCGTGQDWDKTTTFKANGCEHVFTVDNAGPPYVGALELACPAQQKLEIVIDSLAGTCTIAVPSQVLAEVSYETQDTGAERQLLAEVESDEVDLTMSQTSYGCLGAIGAISNAELGGSVVLEGADPQDPKEQVGLYLSGEASQGLFIDAEDRFKAESHPAAIGGEQDAEEQLTLYVPKLGDGVSCQSAFFDGEASAASPELAVTAAYAGCGTDEDWDKATTVKTNGCEHVFTVDNSGAPHTGALELDCETPLQIVIDSTLGTCTITVPSQVLAEVSYEVKGTGAERHLIAEVEGDEVDLTMSQTSYGCLGAIGAISNAELSGRVVVRGF